MRRYEDVTLPPGDPRTVARQAASALIMREPLETLAPFLTKDSREKLAGASSRILSGVVSATSTLDEDSLNPSVRDGFVSVLDLEMEGNEQAGYRIEVSDPGGAVLSNRMYVVREDAQYRVLTLAENAPALAGHALSHVDQNDIEGIRLLLDWAYDEIRGVEADSVSQANEAFLALSRQWLDPSKVNARVLGTAAASIMSAFPEYAQAALPALETARQTTKDATEQAAIELAQATAFFNLKRYEESLAITQRLLQANPNGSARLLLFANLFELSRFEELKVAIRERPARPTGLFDIIGQVLAQGKDAESLRRLASVEMRQGNFAVAESLLRELSQDRNVKPADLNRLAWVSLFRGTVTDEDVSTAMRAVDSSENKYSPALQTLAALHVEKGMTNDAKELLFQSIVLQGDQGPSSTDWYVFGRMYEQLGEREAAIAAYNKVAGGTAPQDPSSAYALAQRRLKALQ
jgi:tetratricopeptide (TPR) repeat protein